MPCIRLLESALFQNQENPKTIVLFFVFFTPSPKVPVQSWFDDMNDTELLDLLPFFEGLSKEEEVYGVLQNLRSR